MRSGWLLGLTLVGACGFSVSGGNAAMDAHTSTPDGDGATVDDANDAMATACPGRMYWAADFTGDPRQLDVNGDVLRDWVIRGLDEEDSLPGQLDSGVWRVPGEIISLDTQPKNNFDGTTRIHARMHPTRDDALTDQWGSVVWLNAGYGDGRFAPIMISVTRLGDHETVELLTKDPVTSQVLVLGTQIVSGTDFVDLALSVDAATHVAVLGINSASTITSNFQDMVSNGGNDDRWATLTAWDVETDVDLLEVENCP